MKFENLNFFGPQNFDILQISSPSSWTVVLYLILKINTIFNVNYQFKKICISAKNLFFHILVRTGSKKLKHKHKGQNRSSQNQTSSQAKSSTSSKDTEATGVDSENSGNGNNANDSPQRRVSRFPGQIKPKR